MARGGWVVAVCSSLGAVALVALVALIVTGSTPWRGRGPGAQPSGPEEGAGAGSVDAPNRISRARLDSCPGPGEPSEIGGSIEIELFIGVGVEPVRAREVVSAARRYWSRHAVEIGVRDSPVEIANTSMFVGGFDEVASLADDRQALAELLYAELREFLRAHAQPPSEVINVVIVRDIVHPRAAAAAVLGDLVGLTLAPALLESGDPATLAALDALGLDAFEPTVLLSDRHLSQLSDVAFTAAVAHELGHVMGLVHRTEPTNLMAEVEHTCLPQLAPDQLATLQVPGRVPGLRGQAVRR